MHKTILLPIERKSLSCISTNNITHQWSMHTNQILINKSQSRFPSPCHNFSKPTHFITICMSLSERRHLCIDSTLRVVHSNSTQNPSLFSFPSLASHLLHTPTFKYSIPFAHPFHFPHRHSAIDSSLHPIINFFFTPHSLQHDYMDFILFFPFHSL